jgi:hypothetical protein
LRSLNHLDWTAERSSVRFFNVTGLGGGSGLLEVDEHEEVVETKLVAEDFVLV